MQQIKDVIGSNGRKGFFDGGSDMSIDEIRNGESATIEFKETLPEKSIKYMKSVVAFANGCGGQMIFGIEDGTGKVVGIDREDVFRVCDAIANAVSDSCEPTLIPDITLQTVDGKTVVVLDIPEGRQRPYFIRSMGREAGVYVREDTVSYGRQWKSWRYRR